jgi:hypothetical protein
MQTQIQPWVYLVNIPFLPLVTSFHSSLFAQSLCKANTTLGIRYTSHSQHSSLHSTFLTLLNSSCKAKYNLG